MDALTIQKEIDICEHDNTLTSEQKNIRKYIYSIAMQQANREKLYEKQIEKYKKQGRQIEQLTNKEFILDYDIVATEGNIIRYLVKCELGNYLKDKNIKGSTLSELLIYANELHQINKEFNPKVIKLIVEFYETLEKIGTIEEETINVVAMGLSEFIDKSIMAKDYKKFVFINSEKAKIKSIENESKIFQENHTKALQTIKKYRNQLGEQAYLYAVEMIEKVFGYYENGNKKIDI